MFRWSCPLAVLLVVGAVGCGSGAKPLPGSICDMNSDCDDELVCTYGRCHVMCDEAKDCFPGQLCAGPKGAGVCVLPEEETCGLNSDCGELFCAIDNKCRTQCETEHDCPTPTQRCVPSVNNVDIKVCAEPPELVDDMLPRPDGGAAPDAGTDASDASGSDAGADGAADSVPDAGDAGPSGDAGGVIREIEPNEDRDHPNSYTPGATVLGSIGSATDVDFYETVAPAGDSAGGYYQASITEVGAGRLSAIVYTMSDSEALYQVPSTGTNGAFLFFYWAAVPGQTYRIAVKPAGSFSAPYDYTFKIQYTRINDTFEPNDTRDAPKMIDPGTPITAYFFTGFKAMLIDPAEYEDWFIINLAAGMTTVNLENVANNYRPLFEMMDDAGNMFPDARKVSSGVGAAITDHTFMVTTPGRYRAVIRRYSNLAIAEADNVPTVPENFTKPYTLTISQ